MPSETLFTVPAMAYDPFDLETQQGEAEEASVESERAGREAAKDLKDVMSTASGRRVIWSVIDTCGLFRAAYTGGDGTIFNEGMRNVALKLVAQLRAACPSEYLTMLEEHHL